MQNKVLITILSLLLMVSFSCSSKKNIDDLELDEENFSEENFQGGSNSDQASSELDEVVADENQNTAQGSEGANQEETNQAQSETEPLIADEANQEALNAQAQQTETPALEQTPSVQETILPDTSVSGTPGEQVIIQGIKFKPNDSGGVILIEANAPVNYATRINKASRQFIVEIENAILSDKVKRTLNTKDIEGVFGAVDAYQNQGSLKARFVMQMRDQVPYPVVQAEGNTLLVIAAQPTSYASDPSKLVEGVADDNAKGILSPQKMHNYLSDNTKFYGSKISIEMDQMDVRDAIKFITDQSGINLIIGEKVAGASSLKLRNVPWDQALVLLMRTHKLGYVRQGNVLRIEPLDVLKDEEEESVKLYERNKTLDPIIVKIFPVSFAKADELAIKLSTFISKRGAIITEARTNSLIISDIEQNLDHIAQLIKNLDVQPPQVLIEGKIVEATESFSRDLGINWGLSGTTSRIANTSRGPLNITPSTNFNPQIGSGSAFNLNLQLGTLDFLGTLSATLALNEREDKVKVISSPRILTLSNEKASIEQKTQEPVRSVTTTDGVPQTSFTFKDISIKLEVTPQTTAEGSILMDLNVKREFKGANQGGASGDAFAVNTREAKTKVLVKNGQTVVVGGIYKSDATEIEAGVPWFKDIPLIGGLFKSKSYNSDKSELIIFLTPRIMPTAVATSEGGE